MKAVGRGYFRKVFDDQSNHIFTILGMTDGSWGVFSDREIRLSQGKFNSVQDALKFIRDNRDILES